MSNFSFSTFTPLVPLNDEQIKATVDFLHTHLQQYGDPPGDIQKAIQYALDPHRGGFILQCLDGQQIIGAVVVNKTGMEGYIPGNILVYIAVNQGYRGNGIGKRLMEQALELAEGGVALHVEPDNPAKRLYERLGFENKYLEMRYNK